MRTLAALALCATLVTGCVFSYGQLDVLQYGDSFDDAYLRFNRSVRWGAWQKALPLVVPEQREEFDRVMSALAGYTFTDWEVVVLDMAGGLGSAHVEVRIEGYHPATLQHRQATLVQEWERIDKRGNWQVRPQVDRLYLAFVGSR